MDHYCEKWKAPTRRVTTVRHSSPFYIMLLCPYPNHHILVIWFWWPLENDMPTPNNFLEPVDNLNRKQNIRKMLSFFFADNIRNMLASITFGPSHKKDKQLLDQLAHSLQCKHVQRSNTFYQETKFNIWRNSKFNK